MKEDLKNELDTIVQESKSKRGRPKDQGSIVMDLGEMPNSPATIITGIKWLINRMGNLLAIESYEPAKNITVSIAQLEQAINLMSQVNPVKGDK